MGETSFFEVAQPIERELFLSITREVLESSLLVMAPFGLPRCIYIQQTTVVVVYGCLSPYDCNESSARTCFLSCLVMLLCAVR